MGEPIDAQAPSTIPDAEALSPSKKLMLEVSSRLADPDAGRVSIGRAEETFVVVSSPDGKIHLALIAQPGSSDPDNKKLTLRWLNEEKGIIGEFSMFSNSYETRPQINRTERFGEEESRQADWEEKAFDNSVNSWKKTGGIEDKEVSYGDPASTKELTELAEIVKDGRVNDNLMQAATSYYQNKGGAQILPPIQLIKS